MKIKILAVHDRALDAYMRPMFVPTIGAGIRAFQDEVNNPESPMNKHPDDYDLFNLGDWDDNTGQFSQQPKPINIAVGKQLITKE